MRQLLLVTALTCSITTSVCSDLKPDQTMKIEYLFSYLSDPHKRRSQEEMVPGQSPTFDKIKAFCANHRHVVKKAVNGKGHNPFIALFHGALNLHTNQEFGHSVEWHFSYPIFCELLACGLNPHEKYSWDNPITQKKEIKNSFYEELEAHKHLSDVSLILAQARLLELWMQENFTSSTR